MYFIPMQILKNVKKKYSQIYPTKIAFIIPYKRNIYFIIIRVKCIFDPSNMFDFGFLIFKHSIL